MNLCISTCICGALESIRVQLYCKSHFISLAATAWAWYEASIREHEEGITLLSSSSHLITSLVIITQQSWTEQRISEPGSSSQQSMIATCSGPRGLPALHWVCCEWLFSIWIILKQFNESHLYEIFYLFFSLFHLFLEMRESMVGVWKLRRGWLWGSPSEFRVYGILHHCTTVHMYTVQ